MIYEKIKKLNIGFITKNMSKIFFLIILFILVYLSFYAGARSLGAPASCRFVIDFLIFLLIVLQILHRKKLRIKRYPLCIFQVSMLVLGSLISIINGLSPLLAICSIIFFLRYNIFFVSSSENISANNAHIILNVLEKIFYIDFVVILLQFFAFGIKQDFLNGIFGIAKGYNMYNNLLFVLIVTYSILCGLFGLQKAWNTILIVLMSLFAAALMELKYYFVELIMIFILCSIFYLILKWNRKAIRTILLLSPILVITVILSVCLMIKIFPYWDYLLNVANWIKVISHHNGYNGTGDINRLFFVSIINEKIFNNDIAKIIFGIGLGASEVDVSFISNPFLSILTKLHVQWFSLPKTYMECGIVGIILYLASFIFTIVLGIKWFFENKRKIQKIANKVWLALFALGIIITIMSIPMLIYDASLIHYCAIYFYFGISCMYIGMKEFEKDNQIENSIKNE